MQKLDSRRAFIATIAAAWPAARLLRGQEKETTFSTDVKVVNVFATVRDKKNQIVSNLGKDDFTVTEDDRPQTIKYFSRETDLPLTLGLLVDTSMSQRRVLGQEKTASYHFLDKVLRADRDKTFVIHFDHDTELLQDLTSSRTDLQKALDEIQLPSDGQPQLNRGTGPSGGGGYPGGGGGQRRRGGGGPGTTMYDAIYLAANEIMKKQTGRKAVILLTDGVDNGSKTFLSDAIEAAQRADTIAYSILFSDEESNRQPPIQFGGRGRGMGRRPAPVSDKPDGKKILQRISRETGGSFFEVTKKQSIDDIYDRIQEELRNQYSIGYTPDQAQNGTGYRAIKVLARDTKYTVQSREGYYPNVK